MRAVKHTEPSMATPDADLRRKRLHECGGLPPPWSAATLRRLGGVDLSTVVRSVHEVPITNEAVPQAKQSEEDFAVKSVERLMIADSQ